MELQRLHELAARQTGKAITPNSGTMERHVTFVETPEKAAAEWLQRQHTSPAISAGNHVSLPVLRRTTTKGPGTFAAGGKEKHLDMEATQLFERERSRLMEKPGATTTHRHHSHQQERSPGTWADKEGGGGGGGGEGAQHTQYIRRLVDLRDELINQEETGLARALDRLRLHSINNREAARYRLKIKDPAAAVDSPRMGFSVPPGVGFPRPMLTTVEKFRQMRPQRRPPVIFPLQGKQLIESSPVSTGNTTRSSTQEGSRVNSSANQRGVEDTVKANLQRLIQPTSSIPNIGRKALRQESLELKSQSLQNMRNRVYKSNRHLVSPFTPHAHHLDEDVGGLGADGRTESAGEIHLSPLAYKLGPMTDGDRLNMDKLNQYYYIYCMPETPSSKEGDGRSLTQSTPKPGQRRGIRFGREKTRRTSSERSFTSRPFSDRSSLGMVVSSDTEVEASSNPRYKQTLETVTGSERISLPVIHAESESLTSAHNDLDSMLEHRAPSLSPDGTVSTERRKRHIVIDMPHIIFNAATPDISKEPAKGQVLPLQDKPGVLSKTLKQNEIRHRELQNLLEDVKELNKRTETLNTHAQNTELDSSSGVYC